MIITLEGADYTGKTTLANELVKLGFAYRHEGPPETTDLFTHYTSLLMGVQPGQDVVFDRLHLGELAYGPAMRGRSLISTYQARLLNRLLFARGGILVLCTAAPAAIISGWRARQRTEYVDGQAKLERVIQAYVGLWLDELKGHPQVWRYPLQNWKGQADAYAAQLQSLKSISVDLTAVYGAAGAPRAKYLIVGERVNGPWDVAFHADRCSSLFLNHALWRAGYREPELLLVNAVDHRGKSRDFSPLAVGRTVVALGRVAQRACQGLGVPHLAAPHPQYWKRFKQGQEASYIDLFRSFRKGQNETNVEAIDVGGRVLGACAGAFIRR